MPHLKYNGRHWKLSSDELFVPGLAAIVGRTFWSLVLIIILSYSTARLSRCSNTGGLLIYLYLSLAVFIGSLFCEVMLVKKSLIGSMVETAKRDEGIGKLFTAHIILGTSQFFLAIFGVFVVSANSFIPCATTFQRSRTYNLILLSVIIISQLVDISSLVCCCYVFSSKQESAEGIDDEEEMTSIWENRCKLSVKIFQIFTCNLFGGSHIERDLRAVAKILTTFFHHDGFLDVVPSDVLAGIILVRMQQRYRNSMGSKSAGDLEWSICNPSADVIPGGSGDVSPRGAEDSIDDRDEHKSSYSALPLSLHSVSYRRDLLSSSRADRAVIESAAKYAVYMIALYTHLMVMYTQPCTGSCSLLYAKTKFSCRNKESEKEENGSCQNSCCVPQNVLSEGPFIRGDNFCGMNHAGLSHFTRNVQSEVVYASYENDTIQKPFAVFVNEEDNTIVIAIRGSLSIEDCITDAIADPVELAEAGVKWGFDGVNRYAHAGFLNAAESIRQELEDSNVLINLFKGGNEKNSRNKKLSVTEDDVLVSGENELDVEVDVELGEEHTKEVGINSNYQLVIVGHSLGAAVAAVLSLFLRTRYPNLKCLGYGMPASVFDWQTSQECSEYVTSLVLGTDLVARMSMHAFSTLREDVLDCIGRAKVHKLKIYQGIFKDLDPDSMMHPKGKEPESEFVSYLKTFNERMRERVLGSESALTTHLYIPGRAIHFKKPTKVKSRSLCQSKKPFTPQYAPSIDFCSVVISPTMARDHLPDRYIAEISRIWNSWNE